MQNLRDIKRRIKSVKEIQKITRAMKMVAAARLKRAEQKFAASLPYHEKLSEIIGRLMQEGYGKKHPLMLEPEGAKPATVIVISSDKGLCGGYNNNILKHALKIHEQKKEVPGKLITIGKKAINFFKKMQAEDILFQSTTFGSEFSPRSIEPLFQRVCSGFVKKEVGKVTVVYHEFISRGKQGVVDKVLLPFKDYSPSLSPERPDTTERSFLYEPPPEGFFDRLLAQYIQTCLYKMLLESEISEQFARMNAMDAASDNARELIDDLTLEFNSARQAAITREILDIVGGAEALKK